MLLHCHAIHFHRPCSHFHSPTTFIHSPTTFIHSLKTTSDITSDQANNFPSNVGKLANYLDPDLNVELPVFSIHGNHDDPSGDGGLSAMDLLATAGLVNYFGKAMDLDDLHLR